MSERTSCPEVPAEALLALVTPTHIYSEMLGQQISTTLCDLRPVVSFFPCKETQASADRLVANNSQEAVRLGQIPNYRTSAAECQTQKADPRA